MVSLNPLTWFKKEAPVEFPSKRSQDYATCVSVLDLTGSAFCLDNQNILFKDTKGDLSVLKPVTQFPALDDSKNLTAKELDDGFTVKWEDKEYFYHAKYKVLDVSGHKFFQIINIYQDVYSTTVRDDSIVISNRPEE